MSANISTRTITPCPVAKLEPHMRRFDVPINDSSEDVANDVINTSSIDNLDVLPELRQEGKLALVGLRVCERLLGCLDALV